MSARQYFKLAALVGGAMIVLTACEPKVALRGNDPLESRLEQIAVGQSTKRDVAGAIGTPSMVGTFDDSVWYYLSQRKETWAFYSPEVVEHKVLAFHFNADGVLQEVKTYDEESLNEISYRDKETPTSGRTMSVFEQLFGNFGKVGG
ncbi:MAG: outer membrane protein assembly factor BamE [Alphaproteobacteria bacterium]|nr:outer membrane protein assembly factor BamE [Alphaproteobacteria bacterium]